MSLYRSHFSHPASEACLRLFGVFDKSQEHILLYLRTIKTCFLSLRRRLHSIGLKLMIVAGAAISACLCVRVH